MGERGIGTFLDEMRTDNKKDVRELVSQVRPLEEVVLDIKVLVSASLDRVSSIFWN